MTVFFKSYRLVILDFEDTRLEGSDDQTHGHV